jgi:hypothetical protein
VKKGFLIDSLPRTGSTTLARVLSCHPAIKCLIEPFHPRRYDGQFYRMALDAGTAEPVLNLIWYRWTGIKHVWDASREWPLPRKLSDSIIRGVGHVIFLERRNLLRRYVSGVISQQLDFWIGTRQQFQARLENAQLKALDSATVLREIKRDRVAMQQRLEFIKSQNVPLMHLYYEDIFDDVITLTQQFEIMSNILIFLGLSPVSESVFMQQWAPLFDRNTYRWASSEIYRMIPGVEGLDREAGSDETGWLFQS